MIFAPYPWERDKYNIIIHLQDVIVLVLVLTTIEDFFFPHRKIREAASDQSSSWLIISYLGSSSRVPLLWQLWGHSHYGL